MSSLLPRVFDAVPAPIWERPVGWPPPPVNVLISVRPKITMINRQDSSLALLAGAILGFAAAFYMSQNDET